MKLMIYKDYANNIVISGFSRLALLVLYLTDVLLYTEDFSTVLYHSYAQTVYTSAVLAAILADSLLDKYK